MRKLRITWDEVEALIKKEYGISDIRLLHRCGSEGMLDICEMPEIVEGELTDGRKCKKGYCAVTNRHYDGVPNLTKCPECGVLL